MPKLTMRDAESLFTLALRVEAKNNALAARAPVNHRVKEKLIQAARLIDEAGREIRDSRRK